MPGFVDDGKVKSIKKADTLPLERKIYNLPSCQLCYFLSYSVIAHYLFLIICFVLRSTREEDRSS